MPDLQTIGRALSGFGAGVAGRGPEYLAGLRAQDQALSDERKRAMLQDAFEVRSQLQAGNTLRAREILQDRVAAIQDLGGDPTDTMALLQQLDAGDISGAFREVSTLVEFAQAEGLLKPDPTAPRQQGTSLIRNLEAAGLKQGTPEFQAALMQQLNRSGQTINVGGDGGLSVDEKISLAARTKRAEELAKTRASGVGKRETEDIDSGSLAARAVPNLIRSLDLLKSIKTGGVDAALLKGKQFLGVETANEAELVNALSQNVLQQLRPIFGAQFTKNEGDWLKAIEAGPNKSTPGNIRLLERGLKLAKRRANIGQTAAIAAQDFRVAQEIKDFLTVDLTPPIASGEIEFLGFE